MNTVAEPLLEVRGLCRSFGETVALNGVNTTVPRGTVHCIIGPSGCGKSTLLRCINWLETPDYGEISLEGETVGVQATPGCKLTAKQVRKLNLFRARMGMVFQGFNVWPHMSVLDNVVRGQKVVLGRDTVAADAHAKTLLEQVGMTDKLHARPAQLSGGQLQRVAIARALAMDPALLLLDEPTSALDPELVGEVLGVLLGLAHDGMTMLIVTHELGFARRVADRLIFMDQGEIVEQGPPDELIDAPKSARLKAFLRQLDY